MGPGNELTWFGWEHAHESGQQRVHESDHLGVATRHADPKPLMQCLEPRQDHSPRKNLKGEKINHLGVQLSSKSCIRPRPLVKKRI